MEKREQEWELHLADQVMLTEQSGGQFTQMNKMKLKLQWEMKMKLYDKHEKIKLQKSFGNKIRKMRPEDSSLDQDALEKLK